MKKSRKILSLLTAVCMVISLNTFVAYAESDVPDTKWDDYAAKEFAGGTGAKDDPYLIESAEQLAKISKDVWDRITYSGSYFRLESDIDLSGHRWFPIGDYDGMAGGEHFSGFLDGNGKTITGMVVDQGRDQCSAGLFGYILNSTVGNEVGVKDLTIANAALYVYEDEMPRVSAGILAAGVMVDDGCKSTSVFENITVSGSISVQATDGNNKIGGLIGESCRCIVKNCTTDVTIAEASNTGGMTGISSDTLFENCTAKGTVSGLWGLGGFVGYATSSALDDKTTESTFIKCIAEVDIVAYDWNAGGFVGLAEFGTFQNCASFGKVTSFLSEDVPSRAGGFVGCAGNPNEDTPNSAATFSNCHSASIVNGNNSGADGGFAGRFAAGTATDCSFDSEKNVGLAGIGTNETGQQMAIQAAKNNLGRICEDVYGGHIYEGEPTVDKEPTCTEEGSQSLRCTRCENIKRDAIPKVDHSWDSGYTVDKAATCTEAGSQSIHCSVCDAKKDEQVIAATGHSYGEYVVTTPATCTEKGTETATCANCHHELTREINALGHSYGEYVVTTPATCTEKGTETATCANCHHELTREINALGHKWDDGRVTKEATAAEKGEKTYICSECGETKTEDIPALIENPGDNPGGNNKPADSSQPVFSDGAGNNVSNPGSYKKSETAANLGGNKPADNSKPVFSDGAGNNVSNPGSYKKGETANAGGSLFDGWFDESGNELTDVASAKAGVTYTARWQLPEKFTDSKPEDNTEAVKPGNQSVILYVGLAAAALLAGGAAVAVFTNRKRREK